MLLKVLFRLRWPLLAVSALSLLLAMPAAFAGSGVGGVFNLGQSNSVDAQTSLGGNPAGANLLRLTGTGTAATLRVDAGSGIAINGISSSGAGQFGQSASGVGLYGAHTATTGNASGVYGQTASTDPGSAGVTGRNLAGGPGLQATVTSNTVPPLRVNSHATVTNLSADLLDGIDSSGFWKLGGNAGTTPGTNFLGTSDNQALELKVNGQRALRIEPDATSPNLYGGFSGNSNAKTGAHGVTIAGGGSGGTENLVTDNFGTVSGGVGNIAGDQDAGKDPTTAQWATVSGGQGNTASGPNSMVAGGQLNLATGDSATVVGGAGNYAHGDYSTVVGGGSDQAYGTGSFAAGSFAQALQDGSFVWGDGSGKLLESYGANTVSFGATGGARFVTSYFDDNLPSSGVEIAAGGGSWASLSDRAAKRNLTPVDRPSLLEKLNQVPITSWSYKAQKPSIRHLGPMAQDFRSAFGLGEDSKHIDTIDSEGVALAAIQGLYRQNKLLERQNQSLRTRLARLERAVFGRGTN